MSSVVNKCINDVRKFKKEVMADPTETGRILFLCAIIMDLRWGAAAIFFQPPKLICAEMNSSSAPLIV